MDEKPVAKNEVVEKEEVDPTLLEAAVDMVRAAVHGNGVKKEDVKFVSFEGEVLHFEIFERFVIEPKIAEKLLHGKENGEVVGSHQDARNKAQAAITKAARNPDVRKNTVEMLKKRPDLGFGLDNQFILLERLRQTFVAHEICNVCSGSMRNICQNCQGNGKTHCTKCRGTREVICPLCQGRMFENTPRGRRACNRCKGRGKIMCDLCKHAGTLPCKFCKTTGQVPCKNCTGTGWHSHMTYLEMRARSNFHYEHEKFPEELPPLIDKLRGAMVTEKHCEAAINEEKVRTDELDQASKPDEYFIPYNVRLPWGDIKFLVDGKELPAKLFGFQPSLVHAPPFLEQTAAPGLRALNEAAKMPVNVAAKINEAVRMRAVAEAVLAAAQMPQKRALDYMHKKYPFGFMAETLKTMVAQGDSALKRVTKIPRLIGLALGLVLSAGLYGAYYIGPLRALLGLALDNQNAMSAIDFLLVLIGGAGTTLSIQLSATGALRRAIGKLLPPEKRSKILPKAGQSALWGCIGGLIIYLAMIEAAVMQGAQAPSWYALIQRLIGI